MNPANTPREVLDRGLKDAGALAAMSAFPGLLASAQAQSANPTKQIRLLVPFAAGSTLKTVARSAANELTKILGQTIFVEKKPGASGISEPLRHRLCLIRPCQMPIDAGCLWSMTILTRPLA